MGAKQRTMMPSTSRIRRAPASELRSMSSRLTCRRGRHRPALHWPNFQRDAPRRAGTSFQVQMLTQAGGTGGQLTTAHLHIGARLRQQLGTCQW